MALIYSLLLLALFTTPGAGQNVHLSIPFGATDSSGHRLVIYFGEDPSATYCIDAWLGEFMLPDNRCGSSSVCLYFVDSREGDGQCLGSGLLLDLREYVSPSQSDTYHVACTVQDYPVTLRWQSNLASYYDSLYISILSDGTINHLNMLQTDSLVLRGSTANLLEIIASGPRGTTTGVDGMRVTPGEFVLKQNYPNPFNPTTNFEFRVSNLEFVSLKVFDVFGREVTTLVNEMKSPGVYTVAWNALNQSSGAYFCRLTVSPSSGKDGGIISSKRMVLLKIAAGREEIPLYRVALPPNNCRWWASRPI